MHEAAAYCLENGLDTWEISGQTFHETVISDEMGQAIQVYLDVVRATMETASEFWIESSLSSPATHPKMYGSLDFGAVFLSPDAPDGHMGDLDVTDLKGGEGIVVNPNNNPQLKYYAYLLIDRHPEWLDSMGVRLRIAQPRAYAEERIRSWWTTVGEIRRWVRDELVPLMNRTEYDHSLTPGSWCRFCPAKLVCPMLTALYRAAATADPKALIKADDSDLGRNYQMREAVKFYLKALEDETYRRLMTGVDVPQTKLVDKKSNRVFKQGVEVKAKEQFGAKAFTEPAMKSPAELEKLGPEAKEFVKRYAFMPKTGYTVALASDPKIAVKITPAGEAFAGYASGETNETA